jgi:steroid delta-isomerase-like uncharacterized protein
MKQLTQTIQKASSLFLVVVLIALSGCQQQKPDPSKELKPIVDKYEEIWNNGNLDDLDAIMDSDYVFHANKLPEVNGLDNRKKGISSLRNAYPDLKLMVEDEFFSENAVAARWHITGTNTGVGEMPPTGKSVDWWGIAILHFADGKIKEEWTAFDNQSLMEQLGYTMEPPKDSK